jgi:hypothetical protein
MTIRISEVKTFLKILHSFIENNHKVFEKNFMKNYAINTGSTLTLDDSYDSIKKICLNAKLVVEKENYLNISKLGKEIFKDIDSDKKFNQNIIEKCLTNNYFSSILLPLLKKFKTNKQNKLTATNKFVYELFYDAKEMDLLQILYDLNFLDPSTDMVTVNSNHTELFIIAQSIAYQKPQSQSELDDLILKQKEIGQYAEQIVLNYEKNRLTKLGCIEQAKRVKQISIENTRKGYDIESFNGIESDDIFPDRFIEVKGTSGKKFSIWWSGNEIEKAKELGSEYWIYSVTEINLNTDLEKYTKKPERIPDPYSKIKPYGESSPNDEYLKEQEKKFRVTRND